MKKSYIIAIALVILVAIVAYFALGDSNRPKADYESFAKCLTNKSVKMYGAYWCPHCQNQKKEFGNAWQYVTYVECAIPDQPGQTPACAQAGITGYPTWTFPDSSTLEGEVSFADLSQKSGCPLPG